MALFVFSRMWTFFVVFIRSLLSFSYLYRVHMCGLKRPTEFFVRVLLLVTLTEVTHIAIQVIADYDTTNTSSTRCMTNVYGQVNDGSQVDWSAVETLGMSRKRGMKGKRVGWWKYTNAAWFVYLWISNGNFRQKKLFRMMWESYLGAFVSPLVRTGISLPWAMCACARNFIVC